VIIAGVIGRNIDLVHRTLLRLGLQKPVPVDCKHLIGRLRVIAQPVQKPPCAAEILCLDLVQDSTKPGPDIAWRALHPQAHIRLGRCLCHIKTYRSICPASAQKIRQRGV